MEPNFDQIAQAYENAMLEGDYELALAIQTGVNQAAVESAAQQGFEAGVQAATQAASEQTPQEEGRDAAYSQFLDNTQEIDAANREIARSVKDILAEEQRAQAQQVVKRIVDIHKDESYEHKILGEAVKAADGK